MINDSSIDVFFKLAEIILQLIEKITNEYYSQQIPSSPKIHAGRFD